MGKAGLTEQGTSSRKQSKASARKVLREPQEETQIASTLCSLGGLDVLTNDVQQDHFLKAMKRYDRRMENLESKVQEREAAIAKLEAKVEEQDLTIAQWDATIAKIGAKVGKLGRKVGVLEKNLEERCDTMIRLKKESTFKVKFQDIRIDKLEQFHRAMKTIYPVKSAPQRPPGNHGTPTTV